ncbi:MAG: SprB repeat-containing protein [Flavobacteriales bacterium]|nr:SprB repeat-containing protein [Flavobacteriales bacterium]
MKDADFVEVQAQITLVEPVALQVSATPYRYLSGYNISCYECYNGSIDVTMEGGVPPYSYDWGDEVYTQDRSALGALPYAVSVTDANQCRVGSERITLTQPERSDWQMGGNANTDPDAQYLGTSDAQDVVFKSDGIERFRLSGRRRHEVPRPLRQHTSHALHRQLGQLEALCRRRYSDDTRRMS